MEFMEDDYTKPATGTSTKKMNYYSGIMRHKAVLCKHVTLIFYSQAQGMVLRKISSLIHTKPKNSREQKVASLQKKVSVKRL